MILSGSTHLFFHGKVANGSLSSGFPTRRQTCRYLRAFFLALHTVNRGFHLTFVTQAVIIEAIREFRTDIYLKPNKQIAVGSARGGCTRQRTCFQRLLLTWTRYNNSCMHRFTTLSTDHEPCKESTEACYNSRSDSLGS